RVRRSCPHVVEVVRHFGKVRLVRGRIGGRDLIVGTRSRRRRGRRVRRRWRRRSARRAGNRGCRRQQRDRRRRQRTHGGRERVGNGGAVGVEGSAVERDIVAGE